MTIPTNARKLSDLLRKRLEAAEASTPPANDTKRDAAILAIEQALRVRNRANQRRRMLRFGLASAAVLLLALGGTQVARVARGDATSISVRATGPGGEAQHADGTRAPFGEEVALGRGSRVLASEGGSVHLAFSTGTELDLTDHGEVGVAESGLTQAFRLERGTLSAHVAKLGAGQRFLVRTGDAEVEVRGTRFSVSVASPLACAAGVTTRVRVTEGAVVVRGAHGEVRLGPGDAWPNCEDPTIPTLATSAAAVRPPAPRADDARTGPNALPEASASPAPTAPPSSTGMSTAPSLEAPKGGSSGSSLADENALYQRALSEKRAGNTAAAVGSFEQLLAKYPRSPLAESAAAERMRLFAKDPSARARARSAARDYLARYPMGFARADADSIVAAP